MKCLLAVIWSPFDRRAEKRMLVGGGSSTNPALEARFDELYRLWIARLG